MHGMIASLDYPEDSPNNFTNTHKNELGIYNPVYSPKKVGFASVTPWNPPRPTIIFFPHLSLHRLLSHAHALDGGYTHFVTLREHAVSRFGILSALGRWRCLLRLGINLQRHKEGGHGGERGREREKERR